MNTVRFSSMTRVALRSFFLEASWNYQGQQNLGLAAAIDPALKDIYREAEGLRAARLRALGFFNTNPIAGGLAIGVAIRLERELAEGNIIPAERDRILFSLSSGALAPLGDNLFWFSWLPFCSLVGVWAVLALNTWWAPLLLPLLFCLMALPARLYGLYLGYRYGDEATDLLVRVNINQVARNVKRAVAVMIGASTVILLYTRSEFWAFNMVQLWLTIIAALVFVFMFRLACGRLGFLKYWYPLILMAVGLVISILFNTY